MNGGSVVDSVLMCHAPIVVPGVAQEARARLCRATTEAMVEAAAHVVASGPDVLVIVSPHAPRAEDGFLLAADVTASGDFGRFGVPEVGVTLPGAPDRAMAIAAAAEDRGVAAAAVSLGAVDHGALVPLHFLVAAGWLGPTVRLAHPMTPRHADCEAMGAAIATAAANSGERWAFIASGDMSHRLTPDAPAGFDANAADFDRAVCEAVAAADIAAVRRIDPALRRRAAEDVVDSLDVALGVLGGDGGAEGTHRVLSYEGPYGVGYLVALLGG
ncbi:MAG: hypothetical protein DRJ42_19445 [Deltaproteobacteria bacterium]|nr:MAG: hypothetical protein DRJ42_19445 [Deltaproteobacteria bacterium]